MASERYDRRIDPQEWREYFRLYADWILPQCTGRVLDIGCGQGWLTKEIAARSEVCCIIGVDKFSEQPEENKDAKISYLTEDIPSLPTDVTLLLEGSFDTIVSTEFVEHITEADLRALLKKIRGWLKPDGKFLGSTPNKLVPTVNPFHLKEYTLDELKALFSEFGLAGTYELVRNDLTVWSVSLSLTPPNTNPS